MDFEDDRGPKKLIRLFFECQLPERVCFAQAKLAEYEKEPLFYTSLLNLFQDQSIDGNIRFMAALYFKNGVERYWRANQTNAIKPEEKAALKEALLRDFREPVPQIGLQIAVIISKIARLDCPNNWPELMPLLLDRIRSTDELQQHRSILILLHVVKSLASKRLHQDRIVFEQFSQNLYEFILSLWNGFTMLYFTSIQENAAPQICGTHLEKALLTLRILRKLTIQGCFKPNSSSKCMGFIQAIIERLKDLLECRLRLKTAPFNYLSLLEKHEKFIIKHMKILTEFQEFHRIPFMDFAPQVLEFSFNYVFYQGTNLIFEDNKITFPNFAIYCLNLIKGYLQNNNFTYTSSSSNEQDTTLSKVLTQFFTEERLCYIIEKLIMHYFLITSEDMENWDSDPESFVSDEGGDSWKYNLKACTEAFYMVLFHKYSSILINELQKFIEKSQALRLGPDSDIHDILIKESIYNASGLASFLMWDEVDFDKWFSTQLIEEIKIKEPHYRILRKRIIWLIGQWTGVKFSKELRPLVYGACLELLQPSEDIAVRLTASKTLKNILDDFDFCAEQFLDYLEPSFSLLFNLLREAKECDTKMSLLNVMSFIVEKLSLSIKIQANNLVLYLPLLWDEGNEHNMLRVSIISALLQIIKAIFEVPDTITEFVYKVIQISTNVNDPSHVYLLDEGLELWLLTLQYTPQINDVLFQLCENLIPIIEKSSINLRTCLYIMQAYVFLCPDLYLQKYGKEVIQTCHYLIKDVRPEGIVVICKLFSSFLKAKPEYGIEFLKPVLVDITRNLIADTDYLSVKQIYLQVIARYLLIDQGAFSQVLCELKTPDALEKLLNVWFDTMRASANNEDKKLAALALCSLLTVSNDTLFEKFPMTIQCIYETLTDIMKADCVDGVEVDSLIFTDDDSIKSNGMYNIEDYEYHTPHYERCKKIFLKDPVHTIILKDYLQNQLINLKTNLGEQQYEKILRTVDIKIHKELFNYVNTLVEIA